MTIFNVGGGGGGDGSPTFKEMTTDLYEIKTSDWGNHYTRVPTYFFYNHDLLEKMELPQGITYIDSQAFRNCSSLKEVIISQGVTGINTSAFRGCTSLSSMLIPQSITAISSEALYGIGSSTQDGCTITILATTPPTIQSSTLSNARINKIIVPQGTLTTYQTATNWSAYAQYMEEAA